MRKLTVLQYSREIGKSTVTIYKKIELGEIKAETINGKIFVLAEDLKPKDDDCKSEAKRLKSENELLKSLIDAKNSEIETLKYSFNILQQVLNRQIAPTQEAEIINEKPKKKKKKKR